MALRTKPLPVHGIKRVVTGGSSSAKIRGAYQAWNFINGALQSEVDRSILKRYKSPREDFDHLEKWYDPESEVATQKLYDKFHDFTIPPNINPIEVLHALEDTNNQMAEKGMGSLTPSCTRVLSAHCL